MPLVVHEIDPNADTVIILMNPSKDFAPWDENIPVPPNVPLEPDPPKEYAVPITFDKKAKKKVKKAIAMTQSAIEEPAQAYATSDGAPAKPEVPFTPLEAGVSSLETAQADTRSTSKDFMPEHQGVNELSELSEPVVEEVRYLVSSRHLTLASPWFRRTMTGAWSDTNRDETDGLFHITTTDWDEEAFRILLSILHLRNYWVPPVVCLQMLAKIAVLVDYYELEEAIQHFIMIWIEDLRKKNVVPKTYCRELMLWMWVAQVFDLKDVFAETSRVALQESTEQLQTLELPLHPGIARRLNEKRCEVIEDIICSLHDLLQKYRSAIYICPYNSKFSFECGSIMFGALATNLDTWKWLSPRPSTPFAEMNIRVVQQTVKNVRSPRWAHFGDGFVTHECNLRDQVERLVEDVTKNLNGLSL